MLSTSRPWLFADESKSAITSLERIKRLFDGGYYFEACASLALSMEAMLFLTVLLRAMFEPKIRSDKIIEGMNRLTLGGLITRARKHSMLEPDLLVKLSKFKEDRNTLVHEHLPKRQDFNYPEFFKEGTILIEELFDINREDLKQKLEQQGHPLGEEFTEKWS